MARMRGWGRASDVEIKAFGVMFWTLRHGQVTSATLYRTEERALKAVGLGE